jgi:hypothetical protein
MENGQSTDAPMLTLVEAAAATGRSTEALRSAVRRGTVAAVRNNRGQLLVQVATDPATERGPIATARATELEAEATELRLALARSEAALDAAKAVAAAERDAMATAAAAERAAAERIIAALEAQLAWHRQPWWRRWLGG